MDFGSFFASVPDPRAPNARHDLWRVTLIRSAAVLCGAENCQDMADFGEAKKSSAFANSCNFAMGYPATTHSAEIFRLLDPVAFEAAFLKFMAAFAARLSGVVGMAGQVIAIDGKSLSGAFEAGARATPLHLVAAWGAREPAGSGSMPSARSQRDQRGP